jgi:DNA primase
MPLPGSVIAQINAKLDLLAYVSQYVTLRKRGREYVGLCPFHAEKTPSFSLNAEKQLWHCYGCDAGGDLIAFVKRYENLEFPEALRMLAARAGVELRESPETRRRRSEREAIYEANAVAKAYFVEALRRSPEGRQYVAKRGLGEAVCEKFAVGFAPDEWDGLTRALTNAKVELALAARAGLISTRQNESGYVDFFRRRLMFPICNLTGEVIAFGGRALGDEQPKYLNTKNTAVYTKGQHIYGLVIARRAAAAQEALIVVEGYMDCLALHQAGYANAVATSGTAFTVEQARELRRVANNLYLCFDGDSAGQAATSRNIDMLVDEGLQVRVVTLPDGRDPDEFIREEGNEAFDALLAASQPWVEFKIELACKQIAAKFSNKKDIVRQALGVVARVTDPIERDQYIKMMARKLDISETALRSVRVGAPPGLRPGGNGNHTQGAGSSAMQAPSIDRELIALLLARPKLLSHAMQRITLDDLGDERLAQTYAALCEHADALARGENPLAVLSEAPNVAELTRLALSTPDLPADEEQWRLERLVQRYERQRLERRLYNIDAEMNRLLTNGFSVPAQLRDEYNSLAATLRGAAAAKREGRPE